MDKATHRGNCQVCGHQQHVMNVVLAKHGYTVEFGYFRGTCSGSGKKPIQQDRTITDATIVAMHEYAAGCDKDAEDLRSGKTLPTKIKTGQKLLAGKYQPVYIPFSEGSPEQQTKAVELFIAMAESGARHARAHASDLKKLADRLHGTELVLIVEPVKTEKPVTTVDVKTAKVTGTFATKTARQAELDKVAREYQRIEKALHQLTLDVPNDQRTKEQTDVYYAIPMYLHQWKAKHSAMVLKVFPQAQEIVTEIEQLVKVREAIRSAP